MQLRGRVNDVLTNVEESIDKSECLEWALMDENKCMIDCNHHKGLKDASPAEDQDWD